MKAVYGLAALPVVLSVLAGTPAAEAQPFLSGVVAYVANSNGGSISEPSEYDNINGTGNFGVDINGQPRGTTFALSLGLNNFTFTNPGSEYNALSLYFAPTGAAFSRPFGSVPDLVGYTMGSGPLTPVAGAGVQTNGQFSGTVPWSGASVYSDGAFNVTYTQLTPTAGATPGTFQLEVTAAPEPTLAALLAAPFCFCLLARRRR
jgi:hypothetical protein